MSKNVLLTILLLIAAWTAECGNLKLQQANIFYHNQDYKEAANLYMQMLEDGYKNNAIYYNAGNAFYKSKELGKAHWCFLQAQEQDKGNILIEENLALTRQKAKIGNQQYSHNWLSKVYHTVLNIHTPNRWASYAFVFCLASALIFAARKVFNLHTFFKSIEKLCFAIFVFHLAGIVGLEIHKRYTRQGVVIKSVDLKKLVSKNTKPNKQQLLQGSVVDIIATKNITADSSSTKVITRDGTALWLSSDVLWEL